MSQRFAGKVCLVTGAGRGIGRGIALALAAEGVKVALLSRTGTELNAVAEEIARSGGQASVFAADVSDLTAVVEAVTKVQSSWGGVDILINAAGIIGPGGPLHETDPTAWARTQQINVLGTYYTMHACLPHMISKRSGRIINVASTAAVQPATYFSAYAVSKAAVLHLTRTVAEEVKPFGITVNAVGVYARTQMWADQANEPKGGPFSAWLKEALQEPSGPTVEENLPYLLFLASEAAAHITGSFVEANALPTTVLR